jgi:hypothetical protein
MGYSEENIWLFCFCLWVDLDLAAEAIAPDAEGDRYSFVLCSGDVFIFSEVLVLLSR